MNRLFVTGMAVLTLTGAIFTLSSLPANAQGTAPVAGGAAGDKDPAVDKLEAEAAKLAKQSKAKPKDTKLRAKAAEAYYVAGHTSMVSPKLGPKAKYRGALKFFRKALEIDPKHKKSADEKKMIEDIYKQMGRPIPQ
jgi:tetratricopeptide (TPR) repeat protein